MGREVPQCIATAPGKLPELTEIALEWAQFKIKHGFIILYEIYLPLDNSGMQSKQQIRSRRSSLRTSTHSAVCKAWWSSCIRIFIRPTNMKNKTAQMPFRTVQYL